METVEKKTRVTSLAKDVTRAVLPDRVERDFTVSVLRSAIRTVSCCACGGVSDIDGSNDTEM